MGGPAVKKFEHFFGVVGIVIQEQLVLLAISWMEAKGIFLCILKMAAQGREEH